MAGSEKRVGKYRNTSSHRELLLKAAVGSEESLEKHGNDLTHREPLLKAAHREPRSNEPKATMPIESETKILYKQEAAKMP